jgi:hypothetical protein
MAFSVVAHTIAQSTDTNGFTTSAIDTTGADLLLACNTNFSGSAPSSFSDSYGNTWVQLPSPAGGWFIAIYYALKPVVGAGHTFTVVNATQGPFMTVAAVSGALRSTPYANTGNDSQAAAFTIQPGSITPGVGDFLYTVIGTRNANITTFSVDSGFTKLSQMVSVLSTAEGGSHAWTVATDNTAKNPTWTCDAGDNWIKTVMVAFNPSRGFRVRSLRPRPFAPGSSR